MSHAEITKTRLRSLLRRRRQALEQPAEQHAARAVTSHVQEISAWRDARRVAVYLPADGEIDTAPLCELCRQLDKELFLPVIEMNDSLHFAAWSPDCTLSANRYGIPEPPPGAQPCPTPGLDIIFLPLVGWDKEGGRLGMGGGFYDRTLSGVSGPLLVGLAHACQEVERIPREDWDIEMDFIATDTALYCCTEPG